MVKRSKRLHRIFDYARPAYDTANIVQHRATSETEMSAMKPEVATPPFSSMPDLDMTLLTLSDIDRHPERKMAAIKPEVEITFERKHMAK